MLAVDEELVEWGERLFSRRKRGGGGAGGGPMPSKWTPRTVRREIRLLVARAPEVMVKVTGGGRGMGSIRAHIDYIDREGGGLIDQEGVTHVGILARRELARGWATEGTPIPERSDRREAFNIVWSMPAGTEPEVLLAAVRAAAAEQFADHRYVMALHTNQASPHVHLVVRAESDISAKRLNPRKEDLQRWRSEFAVELRARGIQATATRRTVRGEVQRHAPLWKRKVDGERIPRVEGARQRAGGGATRSSHSEAIQAWRALALALARSKDPEDRRLATAITQLVARMPFFLELRRRPLRLSQQRELSVERSGPER